MNTNHQLREELLAQVDVAYIEFARQLDYLFEHCSFYLERYPQGTAADERRTVELNVCITQLAELLPSLSVVIQGWKLGTQRVLRNSQVEIDILNELWANVQALIYFIIAVPIALEPFSLETCNTAFYVIYRANRIIP